MGGESLGRRFGSQPNAMGLIRLALAFEVLAWHAHALRVPTAPSRVAWFLADIGVDGFLALSGFLITASWIRRPRVAPFLAARARRLLPGLWTCLVVTAFGIVPLATRLAGVEPPDTTQSLDYVLHNAGILVTRWDLAGTTADLNGFGWNGSLWTLAWEGAAYLGVAALGIGGLLRKNTVLVVLAAAWAATLSIELIGIPPTTGPAAVWMTLRTMTMFGCGALLYLGRDHVPYDGRLAVLAVALIGTGVVTVDNYRLVAAPAVAYLCLWLALCLGRFRPLVLDSDLSYGLYVYGFPVQQALLLVGVDGGWVVFLAVSATAAGLAAAASWTFVERPFLQRGRPAVTPAAQVVTL